MENLLNLIIGTISLSLLAYFREALKGGVDLVLNSFVIQKEVGDSLGGIAFKLLEKEWTPVWVKSDYFMERQGFDKETHRRLYIVVEFLNTIKTSFLVYRKGWQFIFITTNAHKTEVYGSFTTRTFRGLRGFVDLEGFLIKAAEAYEEEIAENDSMEKTERKFFNFKIERISNDFSTTMEERPLRLYEEEEYKTPITSNENNYDTRSDGQGTHFSFEFRGMPSIRVLKEDLSNFSYYKPIAHKEPLKDFYINPALARGLEELDFWINKEKWFLDRGLPYNLSWCLYGPPGTGKSSSITEIAKKKGIPILVFDLGTFSDGTFLAKWELKVVNRYKKERTPFILLIEDIDSIFDGRESKVKGLTFSTFINAIQGVGTVDGMFFVITTNNIDKLDHALGGPNVNGEVQEIDPSGVSRRPGRVNRLIEMDPPDEEGRRMIASSILDEFPDEIEKVVKESEGNTGAQLKYLCQLRALDLIYHKEGL